jgi:hypothetical protein
MGWHVTVAEIMYRVASRIDEADPTNPISVRNAELFAAVNEGYLLASLLTLFLVKTVNFPLTGACWYTLLPALPDYLAVLRLEVNGRRVRPSTLTELDAWNRSWQATAGTAARYCTVGSNLLGVTPQATGTGRLTYASAAQMTTVDAEPDLPPAYHPALVEHGVYRVRLKEGAQQLARGLGNLNVYLDSMQELGDWVRNRSRAAAYDVLPIEMALLDRSKLIDSIIKRQAKRPVGVAQ